MENPNLNPNLNPNVVSIYAGNNCTGEVTMIPVMPVRPELGQAYVPYQIYSRIMPAQEALKKGTVFPELVR
jgi:hypothetical protein